MVHLPFAAGIPHVTRGFLGQLDRLDLALGNAIRFLAARILLGALFQYLLLGGIAAQRWHHFIGHYVANDGDHYFSYHDIG